MDSKATMARTATTADGTVLPMFRRRTPMLAALAFALFAANGCAVVSVASTAVSVGAGAVGLASDAAIGTVRIGGKVVGAAADAVIPDGK